MKKIDITHLTAFEHFAAEPIKVDLAYAQASHPRNIFKEAIYQSSAQCWVYKDLAAIALLTARIVKRDYGWTLEIKDCLRTSTAQALMEKTEIVQANPHWLEPPRLLSPPGTGAHPRAMAVDVHPIDANGHHIDMGTPFDWMEPNSARDYMDFPEDVLDNRKKLEDSFVLSGKTLGKELVPLPEEWWDFRFSDSFYDQYAPLSDEELPTQMQMAQHFDNGIDDLPEEHFKRLAEEITSLVDKAYADL